MKGLRPDLVAALTVWALLVPEALALATIAGVSPVVGLYAAPAALLAYAALGSSRHLISGPVTATAALSAATVADVGGDPVELTIALALCVGVIAVIAGLLRLGFLAGFISEPVLKGFIIGLALTIIAGQLPKLCGVEGSEGSFFERLWDFAGQLDEIHGLTLLVGGGTIVLALVLRRVAHKAPAALAAVTLGIVLAEVFDLEAHGVALVGTIPPGLPDLGLPDVGLDDYGLLAVAAGGVMLVGFAEALGAAKEFAHRGGYDIDVNRELVAHGASNVAAGLSSGMVVAGSLSKTAVNVGAGARTRMAGVGVAVLTLVTLLVLTGLFESLPETTLGAVVVIAVVELIDVGALQRLYRRPTGMPASHPYDVTRRPDFYAAMGALAGVLVFDTLPGLFIGITVSLLLLLYRASRPRVPVLGRVPGTQEQFTDVSLHPDNEQEPGIRVLRIEGALFFANADYVREEVRTHAAEPGIHTIILDAEGMAFIDVTAARMLGRLHDRLEHDGVTLMMARKVRLLAGQTPADVYPTVAEAVRAAGQAPPHG